MEPLSQMSLWRGVKPLLLLVEEVVWYFARYHKHTLSTAFRQQTMRVCSLIV